MPRVDGWRGRVRSILIVEIKDFIFRAAVGDITPRDNAGRDMFFKSGFRSLIALGKHVGNDGNRGPGTEPERQYDSYGEDDEDARGPEKEALHDGAVRNLELSR